MFTTGELVKQVIYLKSTGLSWGEVARKMYPKYDAAALRPVLYRMVKDGYYPQSNRLRARLGLVPLRIAEGCPECGQVHVSQSCPASRQPRRVWVRTYDAGHAGGRWE